MDMLKRSLAPIPDAAWEEIHATVSQVLKANLSARRLADVVGPRGLDFSAVPLGRLDVPGGQKAGEVSYGVRKVLPLVETRIPFELDIWELDNAARGAADVDLDAAVEAAKKMAAFEERAVFHGFDPGCVLGLLKACANNALHLPGGDPQGLIATAANAVKHMTREGIPGPYGLLVNADLWASLLETSRGYPLHKHLRDTLGGEVGFTSSFEGALVYSSRGGDAELTVGQDFAVGYSHHDADRVRLFLTESFTFRVLEPKFAVPIRVAS